MNIDYFITENNGIENHAGSKARNDIDEILISKKIKPIRLSPFINSQYSLPIYQ